MFKDERSTVKVSRRLNLDLHEKCIDGVIGYLDAQRVCLRDDDPTGNVVRDIRFSVEVERPYDEYEEPELHLKLIGIRDETDAEWKARLEKNKLNKAAYQKNKKANDARVKAFNEKELHRLAKLLDKTVS